jgi:type VI secretion system secreted protein VgrG
MASYTQQKRAMAVTTPLGPDALLLVRLAMEEGLSRLFQMHLDLVAQADRDIAFDRVLGQPVVVRLELPGGKARFFHGICNRISQGHTDGDFTNYRMEVVPKFWLLTRRSQSRIFQQLSVPDILKKVLQGLDVAFELSGTFHPRDFCVQYRETDFNFASRLMEEEGIYYFFKHTEGGHKMVVANTPQSHADVPGATSVIYETMTGGNRPDDRVLAWDKMQELRSGKYTLWDHCFELPHKHLEADKTIQDSVAVGKVTHKLKVGGNESLELYDYPGEYAQRFDGVAPGGGDRPTDLQKIFADNKRTVEVRMQAEALPSLVIHGQSACRQFTSGHKFSLTKHLNADGAYVLTSVTHLADLDGYRSGASDSFRYANHFTCIPAALPYRPQRATPKPVVQGTQTAVVVGPAGEEIFTDKYGRVKVQFHWDREGKNDANSSCWIRVGTPWAGKHWGMIHIPRIGQEVIVAFQEGDPDQPIIVGSVYNADQMPPYKLPDQKTQSGIKTRSSLKGDVENFNEICFEDKKGEELIYIRAEKNLTQAVENDEVKWIGHDNWIEVDNDETTTIGNNRKESVGKNETITIGNDRTETVGKNQKLTVQNGDMTVKVEKGKILVDAMESIEFVCGASKIVMKKDGTILIKGVQITVDGAGKVDVKSPVTTIKGDGILTCKGGAVMVN